MRCRLLAVLLLLAAPALAEPVPGKTTVQWLGQSAMKITSPGGKVLLLDPWLTRNPSTPAAFKTLDTLGRIDLILVTHGHGDHLGDAPDLAKKLGIPLYAPGDLNQQMTTLGILPANLAPRMNKSGTVSPLGPDIAITMVHAEHSSVLVWQNPTTGKDEAHYGGEPVGFIIRLETGFTIWHMGDTGLFTDMRFIAEYYKPDLVMIPISGNFVMDPKDAAYALNTWIKPKTAIPMHYGTNPLATGTPDALQKALGKTKTRLLVMTPGQEVAF